LILYLWLNHEKIFRAAMREEQQHVHRNPQRKPEKKGEGK
jgi:hypothetical protein